MHALHCKRTCIYMYCIHVSKCIYIQYGFTLSIYHHTYMHTAEHLRRCCVPRIEPDAPLSCPIGLSWPPPWIASGVCLCVCVHVRACTRVHVCVCSRAHTHMDLGQCTCAACITAHTHAYSTKFHTTSAAGPAMALLMPKCDRLRPLVTSAHTLTHARTHTRKCMCMRDVRVEVDTFTR